MSASVLTIWMVGGCRPASEIESSDSAAIKTPVASVTSTPSPLSDRSSADSASTAEPLPEDTRVRQRTIKRAGGVYDLTFDDLEFEIEPDEDFRREMLTEQIEEFNGKQVIIRGFILDSSVFTQKGITQFVLIRDNQVCCFGPGAKIFHNMMVDMNSGKTTDFTIRPVTAKGVLTIEPWVSPADGKTYSVFHLAAESVK